MKTREVAHKILKQARKEKGINQKQLAKLAKTNYQEISMIENGKEVKPELYARICKVLDVDILDLYIDSKKLASAINQIPNSKKTDYVLEVIRRILCR